MINWVLLFTVKCHGLSHNREVVDPCNPQHLMSWQWSNVVESGPQGEIGLFFVLVIYLHFAETTV